MFHMKFMDFEIMGASLRFLVKVEDGTMEVRPIAGTRTRGKTDFEDEQLAQDLLEDEKECAEHLMLVDLGRNDVGRVSEFGSVVIPEYMEIEKYSHVMHIVSQVKGKLEKTTMLGMLFIQLFLLERRPELLRFVQWSGFINSSHVEEEFIQVP